MKKVLVFLSTIICLSLLQVSGIVSHCVKSLVSVHPIAFSQCHSGKIQTSSSGCQSANQWQQFNNSQSTIQTLSPSVAIGLLFLITLWAIKSAPISRFYRPPNSAYCFKTHI